MVFYDTTGIRRLYVIIGAFAVLVLSVVFLLLTYIALTTTSAEELLTYNSHSHDSEHFAKTIALTFDDGPHPVHTPELLELLKSEQVPATFFVVGRNVLEYPEVAKQVVAEGFEIGNHTFSHSEHANRNEERLRKELLSTDRIIRDVTGHTAIMFRPPFLEDVNVGEFDGGRIDNKEMRWVENAGFIAVGANLDTQDWNVSPGDSDSILARIESRIRDDRPMVILMHDHAGEGATIEALRTFIPKAKAEGYRFVFVSEYFGVTKADVMPIAALETGMDSLLVGAARAYVFGSSTFTLLIFIASALGLARLWVIVISRRCIVPFWRKRPIVTPREKEADQIYSIPTRSGILRTIWPGSSQPVTPVSVVIPAYNEAANIEATIASIMSGKTIPEEIIVVNDGSTDNTHQILKRVAKMYGSRIVVLEKENGGSKAGALNYALPHVTQEVMVCIDADTIVESRALEFLFVHFKDSSVGAIAGKVYPASTHSLFSKFQYLEYTQGQNLEKSVMAVGNAIGIVPGAIGAWRTAALKEVGGYSSDTVVEDQDITLALLSHGWKVNFEPRAIAYTETPDTLRSFFKQRSRWVYGTIQCMWKYRSWIFSLTRPSLGWLVLPNILFFGLFMAVLIPFVDIAMLLAIFGWVNIWTVVIPFIIYTLFDMWCAIEGIAEEKSASIQLIPLIIWQRFFYRYVISATVIHSISLALLGNLVGWGVQTRRGACHAALNNVYGENAPVPATQFSSLATEPLVTRS